MVDKERRKGFKPLPVALLRQLNEAQRMTLTTIGKFGWEVRFIRHPMFLPPVPVVYDPDHRKYAVLETDGSLNETDAIKVRD